MVEQPQHGGGFSIAGLQMHRLDPWRPSAPARAQLAAPPAARSESDTAGPDSCQRTATRSRCTGSGQSEISPEGDSVMCDLAGQTREMGSWLEGAHCGGVGSISW